MAARANKLVSVLKSTLTTQFRVATQLDADEYFQELAKRAMMRMGVKFGRQNRIALSTVLEYVGDVFDLTDKDPVVVAIEFFEYLRIEAKDLELELVYDIGEASDAPQDHAPAARGTIAKNIISHFGDEQAARHAIRTQLKKEAKVSSSGALARTARWLNAEAKVSVNDANPRLVLAKFIDDIDAILGNTDSGAAEPTQAGGRHSAFATRLINSLGGDAKAKKALERAIIEAAGEVGQRGARKLALINVARQQHINGAGQLEDYQIAHFIAKTLGIKVTELLANAE
ncbi:MAG: hypothetical protein PHY34_00580 [Patescibacteria group bacterium]|nr:hypothetical protein [Patescibacteria group bacterium]MDD5715875.1 hypothetical protein [Patescibacteria group bacterium]